MPEQLKIFPSELEILKPLWEQGDLTAAQLWILVTERTGWHRNTIYTVINRCVKKGFITRIEPNFVCCPRITKKQAQEATTRILMKDFYDSDPFALYKMLEKIIRQS